MEITTIVYILLMVVMLICFVCFIKNENTYRNCSTILDAICLYRLHCIRNDETPNVSFMDMKDYDDICNCFWDWGYKHILPEEKFKLIEPFIKCKEKPNEP